MIFFYTRYHDKFIHNYNMLLNELIQFFLNYKEKFGAIRYRFLNKAIYCFKISNKTKELKIICEKFSQNLLQAA